MYNIVKMIGVRHGVNQRWIEINKNTYTVTQLCDTFRKCYITLTEPDSTVHRYLDLDSIKSKYNPYNDTLPNLLIAILDATLPLISAIPTIRTRRTQFRDAFLAGYTVTPVHPLYGINTSIDNRTALRLTRTKPVTSYLDFYKHCLVTVNGFYHMTDTNNTDGVVVYDAMKSLTLSNQNQAGICSFKEIGDIELVPITEDMIYKQDENEPFKSSAYVKTGKDLTNKSVMLVIGGYLHVNDENTFTKVNDDSFKINFSNYPMLDRYYESSNYIDLSSLGLTSTTVNKNQISVTELLSDESIKQYLMLSQSFFVIVNTPELYTAKQYIKRSNLYGNYVSYIEPKLSLVTGLGRHPEYVSVKDDGQWAVTIQDNTIQDKIYDTVNPLSLVSVDDSNLPKPPERTSGAYFLEIGSDI